MCGRHGVEAALILRFRGSNFMGSTDLNRLRDLYQTLDERLPFLNRNLKISQEFPSLQLVLIKRAGKI